MDVLGFALAVLLIELTPGPNMAWLAGLAATEGRRAGFAAVIGIAIGLLTNAMLAAFGLAALLQAAPQLWVCLRLGGAAMMLWLAIGAWRSGDRDPAGGRPVNTAQRAFATGAFINLLNPKAYIFFVVIAPQFLDKGALTIRAALVLSVVSAGIATFVHIAIVLGGSAAHDWLLDPARTRIVRRAFAILMFGIALTFLIPAIG